MGTRWALGLDLESRASCSIFPVMLMWAGKLTPTTSARECGAVCAKFPSCMTELIAYDRSREDKVPNESPHDEQFMQCGARAKCIFFAVTSNCVSFVSLCFLSTPPCARHSTLSVRPL